MEQEQLTFEEVGGSDAFTASVFVKLCSAQGGGLWEAAGEEQRKLGAMEEEGLGPHCPEMGWGSLVG